MEIAGSWVVTNLPSEGYKRFNWSCELDFPTTFINWRWPYLHLHRPSWMAANVLTFRSTNYVIRKSVCNPLRPQNNEQTCLTSHFCSLAVVFGTLQAFSPWIQPETWKTAQVKCSDGIWWCEVTALRCRDAFFFVHCPCIFCPFTSSAPMPFLCERHFFIS